MQFSRAQNFFVVLVICAFFFYGASFILSHSKNLPLQGLAKALNSEQDPDLPPPLQKLANPPEIVKSVFVTGYSAGSKVYMNYLAGLLNSANINAVVVDIKGSDGFVSYASNAPEVKKYNLSNEVIGNINSLVEFLHSKNVYVIGRIAVFEDPVYSKARPELAIYNKEKTSDLAKPVLWRDNNGLSWLDPASKEVWDYNISLAKDALYHGFDEINFDYVRFATDGNIDNMGFPVYNGQAVKADVIKDFFKYTRSSLAGEKISVDLFGLTTVNNNGMGIGQVIENALANFDYVCPMVYPSHYSAGFMGFANPALHPYEVIKYSLDSAEYKKSAVMSAALAEAGPLPAVLPQIRPMGKLRPWLQDFNMGAVYTNEMVQQEVKAVQDSLKGEYAGFMLWNPSNYYTYK